MFDQFRLKDVLVAYKQNFVAKQWGDEKYKWEAVKWFQNNTFFDFFVYCRKLGIIMFVT